MLKRALAVLLLSTVPAQAQNLPQAGQSWLGPEDVARLSPPPSDPYAFQSRLAEAVMNAVNGRRAEAGLPPLSADPDLGQAAGASVAQLRDSQVYGGSEQAKPLSRRVPPETAIRYVKLGENLWSARGAIDWSVEKLAEQTAETWATRANLAEPGFTEAGVATVTAGDQVFVAMVMAQPKDAVVPASVSNYATEAPAADLTRIVRALPGDLLTVVNAGRVQQGLAPLRIDETLSVSAQRHSESILETGAFGTEGPDGVSILKRVMDRTPGSFARMSVGLWRGSVGEALAVRAMESWRQDARGSANMLDPRFDRVGVGVAGQGDQAVVTVLYGESAPAQ